LICRTIFFFIKHPLAIGLLLLNQTIFICLIRRITIKTFWFSYVLFIIFLGGILILFIYVTSLASNEIFYLNFYISVFCILTIFMLTPLIYSFDKNFLFNYFTNYDSLMLFYIKNFINENSLILSKLLNFPTNIISILMIIYLFLTLIVIVKITNVFEGPLRPKSSF